jgi:hypothetical protein
MLLYSSLLECEIKQNPIKVEGSFGGLYNTAPEGILKCVTYARGVLLHRVM